MGLEDRRNLTALNNPFSIKEIQTMYPYMQWLSYVNSMLPEDLAVNETEIIDVVAPTYFASVGDILRSTPKRTIANYLMWQLIFSNLKYIRISKSAKDDIHLLNLIEHPLNDNQQSEKCVVFVRERSDVKLQTSIQLILI